MFLVYIVRYEMFKGNFFHRKKVFQIIEKMLILCEMFGTKICHSYGNGMVSMLSKCVVYHGKSYV